MGQEPISALNEEFRFVDRHGLSREIDPVAVDTDADNAAAFRCLIGDKIVLIQFFSPVWSKTAMGGAGHGVFPDSEDRTKKS